MTINWPVKNPSVSGEFGNSPDFYRQYGQLGHNGIDIPVPQGTEVFACDDGVVVAEGWGSSDSWMGSIAGIFVRIRHWWGYSAYAHLMQTMVDVGQTVKRGQKIALSGMTGVGTGPHLHFETFPLYPNFANGYAGRVNPRSFGLVPMASATKPPVVIPPIPKEDLEMAQFAKIRNKRKTSQVLQPNVRTRVLHADGGVNSKTDNRTLIHGPGRIFAYTVNFGFTGGTPGKRFNFDIVVEDAKGKTIRRIGRVREALLSDGSYGGQVTISNPLKKGEKVVAYAHIQAGSKPVKVVSFYGDGYVSPNS